MLNNKDLNPSIDIPSLILRNCLILKKEFFIFQQQNIENFSLLQMIKELILPGNNLPEEILNILSTNCPLLEILDLSKNKVITSIEEKTNLIDVLPMFLKGQRNIITFQNLKVLILDNCENLKTINLKADLNFLSLKACEKLTDIQIMPISLENTLRVINLKKLYNISEKEIQKIIINNQEAEIFIDLNTAKGFFQPILNDIPSFPNLSINSKIDNEISGKYINNFLIALARPENEKFRKKLKIKELTLNDSILLSQEIKKGDFLIENLIINFHSNFNFNSLITQIKSNSTLIESLVGYFYVKRLDLSYCSLGINGYKMLNYSFYKNYNSNKNFCNLICLDLTKTCCNNECVFQLMKIVQSYNKLEKLNLQRNSISVEGINSIANYLENSDCTLKEIDLSQNNIEDQSAKIISKALKKNKSLIKVIINAAEIKKEKDNNSFDFNNRTSTRILTSFNYLIGGDSKIKDENDNNLTFFTRITDLGCLEIMHALEINSTLQFLSLKNHSISNNTANSLKKVFNKSSNLRIIHLKNMELDNKYHLLDKNNNKVEEKKEEKIIKSKQASLVLEVDEEEKREKFYSINEDEIDIKKNYSKNKEKMNEENTRKDSNEKLKEEENLRKDSNEILKKNENLIKESNNEILKLEENLKKASNELLKSEEEKVNSRKISSIEEEENIQKVSETLISPEHSLIKTMSVKRNPLQDHWTLGLSIDGGGMRGIIPAVLIDRLSTLTKLPIHHIFDCVGGTSIGGIIALGLTISKDGKNPVATTSQSIDMFRRYGKNIFGRPKNKMDPKGIITNKYDESGLEGVFKHVF